VPEWDPLWIQHWFGDRDMITGRRFESLLRRLRLPSNRIGPVAIKHLAQSPHLRNLRVLDLSGNPLGDRGVIALAESPYLTNLMHLELMHCEVGDKGAAALLESPITAGLIHLNVHDDWGKIRISDAVKSKLRERFGKRVLV
jgi:Ran GTPase-activating protein (RanGAP) involved in mRNA processing and transport